MKQAGKAAGAGRLLTPVAMAILWLAGAAGGWAAESAAGTHAGGGEAPFLNAWLLLGPCQDGEDHGVIGTFELSPEWREFAGTHKPSAKSDAKFSFVLAVPPGTVATLDDFEFWKE